MGVFASFGIGSANCQRACISAVRTTNTERGKQEHCNGRVQ